MRNHFFISIFFISISIDLKSQSAFQQNYVNGNGGQYSSESIIQLSDSGYLISGSYQYFPLDTSGVLLLRTDKSGNIIYSYVLSGYGIIENKIAKRSAGGFYLLTSVIDSTNFQFEKRAVLFAFSDSLVPYWSHSFTLDPSSFQQKFMVETIDSTLLVSVNGIAARYSQAGNLIWCKNYKDDSLNTSGIYSFDFGSDSSIYFLAETNAYNSFDDLMTVFKTDYYGNIIWSKQYDDSSNFNTPGPMAVFIRVLSDGNLILSGSYGRFFTSSPLLMKLNNNGDIMWSAFYDPISNYYGTFDYIEVANPNSLIIGGSTCISNSINSFKTCWLTADSSGNITFSKCYGRDTYMQKFAKGFGRTNDSGHMQLTYGMYFIKTDSFFNSNCYEWPVSYVRNTGQFFSKTSNHYAEDIVDTAGTYYPAFDITTLITGPCNLLFENEFESNSESVYVYPNPTDGVINFKFEKPEQIGLLQIFNSTGQVISEFDKLNLKNELNVFIKEAGFYYYRIKLKNNKTTGGRFIKI